MAKQMAIQFGQRAVAPVASRIRIYFPESVSLSFSSRVTSATGSPALVDVHFRRRALIIELSNHRIGPAPNDGV
jgi:hypothetical protein